MRKLQDDENIAKIKDIINTLDDFEKDEIIEEYSDKIEKLQDIVSRKDVLSELADTNNIYTDRVDNMDSEYKFILKTDDIKVPQKEEKIEVEQEESGFKKLWNKLFK